MFEQDPIDLYTIHKESTDLSNQEKYLSRTNDRKIAYNLSVEQEEQAYFNYLNALQTPIDFITKYSSALHYPIICHSEKNSNDVQQLLSHDYICMHIWYHAYISLYWFQDYKFLDINHNKTQKRFGIYIRDASSTRSYRAQLLISLSTNNIHYIPREPITTQYPILKELYPTVDDNNINSASSASISWLDVFKFDIHIVAETLFNTEKTYITEKSIKPIVMGQPFILFSGPYSLQYLRNYGFKTFNDIWDESYDNITNNEERFDTIISLIHKINNLPSKKYIKLFNDAKKIALYNRNYFYNTKFEKLLLNELHLQINNAHNIQKELFNSRPGGTWFKILDEHTKQRLKIPKSTRLISIELIKYLKIHHPIIAENIIKNYSHLL